MEMRLLESVKKAWFYMLVLVLLAACLASASALEQQKGFGEYAMNEVNVRRTPGGDILFTKQKGEELFILSRREVQGHTWYEVNTYNEQRSRNVTAWVRADMVIPPEELFVDVVQVAADYHQMIALKADGTAVMGGELHKYPHLMQGAKPNTWQNVKQVAAGFLSVYGLKEDGSVYRWGLRGPDNGTPGVEAQNGTLNRIVKMDALNDTFLGLMEDGSLYSFMGDGHSHLLVQPDSGLEDFSAAMVYYGEAVVVQAGQVMFLSNYSQGVLSETDLKTLGQWQDIVKVEAGFRSAVIKGDSHANQAAPLVAGLKRDGTVVALDPGMNLEVSAWSGMTALESGDGFLLGLGQDGRVRVAGLNKHLVEKEIESWEDIVGLACGSTFCIGLTKDGRVLFAGEVRFTEG